MNTLRSIAAGLCAAVALAASGNAAAAIDQVNKPSPGAWDGINTQLRGAVWQQTVVAGLDGHLTGVDLLIINDPGTFVFFINRGSGWQSDAHDFTLELSPEPSQLFEIDVSAAGLHFAAGESFVIGLHGMAAAGPCCGLAVTSGNNYAAGNMYLNGGSQDGMDFAFQTRVAPVPEPATYALMLGGLALVAGLARRTPA